jgi:putative transposase
VPPAEVAIKHAIDAIYTQYPFYGSRRITVELREQPQLVVARETVQRYMREMGLAAIYPGPNLSRRNPEHKICQIAVVGDQQFAPHRVPFGGQRKS